MRFLFATCVAITLTGVAILMLQADIGVAANMSANKSSHTAFPTTIDTFPAGICETADVLQIISKHGLLDNREIDAAEMMKARIAACREIIHNYVASLPPPPASIVKPPFVPSPFPSPTPNPTEPYVCKKHRLTSNDPARLYAILSFCVAWVKNIPTPAPAASPNWIAFKIVPSPETGSPTSPSVKLIYTLGLAGDAPTSAQLALKLAATIRANLRKDVTSDPYTGKRVQYAVVAAPTWSLAQYQQQCYNDSSTAGAIALLPPSSQSASWNALVWSSTWTALGIQALVIDCEPTNSWYSNNVAYVTWISDVYTGIGRRGSFPLATLLAVMTPFIAFHPVHTTTTTSNFASPQPTPAPGATFRAQVMDQVATNPNALGLIAGAGISALTTVNSISLGKGPGTDAQTAEAIDDALPKLLKDLKKPCAAVSNATQCQWIQVK